MIGKTETGVTTDSRGRARTAAPAVAVLPFANLSTDPENEYFSDGLTEDLISALTQLPGLRVVARTSAFQFKGQAGDIREVGRRLNVGVLLEGSVRRAGDKIRVTSQLVNVADGFQLWSGRYDREMKDVFAIQDEISRAIVKALRVPLAAGEDRPLVKKHTENLEAYHLLLRGRYYWNKWTEEGFRRGMEYYSQAIAADPAYAPAYTGLADCFALLAFWGLAPPAQVMPQAKALALKALQLDDTLAEAHTSLGSVLALYEWDWSGAGRAFRRALELNPGYANAHLLYGACYLMPFGRFDEAIQTVQRALDLDPLSLVIGTYLGSAFWLARQTDRAIQQYRRTLELDPHFSETHRCLGWAYLTAARVDDAVAAFEQARALAPTPITLGDLGYSYGLAGRTAEARHLIAQLEEISQSTYVTPYAIAVIHLGLDDREQAFQWLERAYQEHASWLMWLKSGPVFEPYRSDPRLLALQQKVFGSA